MCFRWPTRRSRSPRALVPAIGQLQIAQAAARNAELTHDREDYVLLTRPQAPARLGPDARRAAVRSVKYL